MNNRLPFAIILFSIILLSCKKDPELGKINNENRKKMGIPVIPMHFEQIRKKDDGYEAWGDKSSYTGYLWKNIQYVRDSNLVHEEDFYKGPTLSEKNVMLQIITLGISDGVVHHPQEVTIYSTYKIEENKTLLLNQYAEIRKVDTTYIAGMDSADFYLKKWEITKDYPH